MGCRRKKYYKPSRKPVLHMIGKDEGYWKTNTGRKWLKRVR